MSISGTLVRTANRAFRRAAVHKKTIVTSVLTGLGCAGSLALAFFGLAAVAFAAWMTALPSNQTTMSHDQAVRQARIGIAMVVVGCVVGVSLVVWIFYRVTRREPQPAPQKISGSAQPGNELDGA